LSAAPHQTYLRGRRLPQRSPTTTPFCITQSLRSWSICCRQLRPPGMGSPLSPATVKHTGQESGGKWCGNFQILIVSAVKICEHVSANCFNLWLTLAAGPPLEDFRHSNPLGYN